MTLTLSSFCIPRGAFHSTKAQEPPLFSPPPFSLPQAPLDLFQQLVVAHLLRDLSSYHHATLLLLHSTIV